MPVFRSDSPGAVQSAYMVDRLAHELERELLATPAADEPLRQPIVLERELPDHTLHVTVVWDKWRLVGPREQAEVIYAAYRGAAANRAELITVAVPATVQEAFRFGLLPFAVAHRSSANVADVKRLREQLASEGDAGIADSNQLLFPNRSSAEAALSRLRHLSSDADWVLLEYVFPDQEPTHA